MTSLSFASKSLNFTAKISTRTPPTNITAGVALVFFGDEKKCLDEAGQESEALDVRKQIVDEWKDRFKMLKKNYDDEIIRAPENVADALDGLADFYSAHEQKISTLKIYKEILENYSLDEEDVAEIQEKIAALTQDAVPEENPSAEIDTRESLALRKGQRVSLTKNNPALNALTLTIYEAEERKQNFSGEKVFVRVIDEAARKEIFRFDLHEDFSVETAIVVGEIYRHKGE